MTFCVGGLDRTPSGVKRGKVVILAQWLIYGLQIRGWGPYPEMRGGTWPKKNFLPAFRASAWSKNKGGGVGPPGSGTVTSLFGTFRERKKAKKVICFYIGICKIQNTKQGK